MKSTYKLLGSFWDGRSVLKEKLPICLLEDLPRNYKCERDLFDANGFFRSVDVADFLRLDDGDSLAVLLNKLKFCEKVVVVVDESLAERNPVIRAFLEKRIMQCLLYVRNYLDGIPLEISKKFPSRRREPF